MARNLEGPACAEQQKGWDDGVYAIRFAECLATGQAVPDAIDGTLKRICLMNAILVTWAVLRRMAASEDDAIQKSALTSLIDSVHMVHRTSLKSALTAATAAATLLETIRQWTTVKNKLDDPLDTLADMGLAGDLTALPAPDQS
ncbi:hypothetical protein CGCSCA4_v012439 [Colletotrichum siamense]|uniref:Uncharacterized protein n=1 Tax=Colletotrichum siamense TaxID=690259 RepID=A0A9P5BQY3_COLSI|nr:hypothetical protein CGCSCA4_v012439 [Colletotrichum siamense]KAF4849382.1 hypothetical protein CGCSCA2_v011905 [Colletotrichum siamense]